MQNIVELVLNLEPCLLQKCNTFYFGNQTVFFHQILLVCNMVCGPTGKSSVHPDISMCCLAQDDCNVFKVDIIYGFVKFKNVRKTRTVLQ